MAQIRKFSGGGSPEASTTQNSPKKPYSFIRDGVVIQLDDQDIADWVRAKKPKDAIGGQAFQDIIDSIKRGGPQVEYDSPTNTFINVKWTNQDIVDELNANRTNPNKKKANRQLRNWAKRDYYKGDARQQHMVGTYDSMDYNFNRPTQQNQETTETPKTSLFGSYGNFQYETDDQGNTSWSQSPLNASALQLLNDYSTLGTLSREEAFKRYNMDETKYNQFMDWYNTYGQNYDWNALTTRIQNKQFDPYDNELLELLGWNINSNQETTPKITAHQYEGAGFDEDYLKQNNLYVRKGSDGNTYLLKASTDANGNVTYNPVTDNIYLRDFSWVNPDSQWAGGAVYGGRFWTQDDLWNQDTDASRAFQSYVNASTARDENGNWSPEIYQNALKNSGWIYAGMDNPNPFTEYQNADKTTLPGFEHITNPFYFQDISGDYTTPEGMKIISFIDPTKIDKDGRPIVQYAVSDYNQTFANQEALRTYLSGLTTPVNPVTGIRPPSTEILQLKHFYDKDGHRFTKAPITAKVQGPSGIIKQDIYRDDAGTYYFLGKNGEYYSIIGSKLMDRISKGQPISQEEYEQGRDYEDRKRFFGDLARGWGIFGARDVRTRDNIKYNAGAYDDILGFKKGGNIPILQWGDKMPRTKTIVTHGEKADAPIGTLHKVGGGPGLTDASDKWANAATALDVGSGALALTGFGNVAAGLAGLGGTAARFVSDIKRDGLDGGDLTRLGLNLGLDILTLIPFAGGAAKAAKIAKAGKEAAKLGKNASKLAETTKKTEELISKADVLGDLKIPRFLREPGNTVKKLGRAAEIALPAVGTAQAAGATINAIKDGEITSDEMATIANGLVSGALLKRGISRKLDRAALKAAQNKFGIKSQLSPIEKTFKNAEGVDIKVTLTPDDLLKLRGQRTKDVEKFLKEKVKAAGAKIEDGTDLIKKFEIPMKDGIVSKVKSKWNKTNIAKQKKLDVFDEKALANDELYKALTRNNLGYWDKRAARAYQYGLMRNSGAHEYITNRFGRSVVPSTNNPFSLNPTKWQVNAYSVEGLPSYPPIPYIHRTITTSTASAPTPVTTPATTISIPPMHHLRSGLQRLSPEERILRDRTAELIRKIRNVKTSEGTRQLVTDVGYRGRGFGGEVLPNKYDAVLKIRPELRDMIQKHINADRYFHGSGIDDYMRQLNLSFKQGGKIIKAQDGAYMLIKNNNKTGQLYDYDRAGIIFDTNGNVNWEKTYNDPSSMFKRYRDYYIANWDKDFFKDAKKEWWQQLKDNGLKTGELPENMSLNEFKRITSDQNLGFAHNLYTNAFDKVYNSSPIDLTKYTPTIENETIEEDIPVYVAESDTKTSDSNGDISRDGLLQTQFQPKWNKFNPEPLLELGKFVGSHFANQRLFDAYRRGQKPVYKSFKTRTYDRFQDYISPIYRQKANETRQFFVPTSTDALTNYAMRQMNEDKAQALELEGDLKSAELYGNYLANDLAMRRADDEDDRNTAFYNRQEAKNHALSMGAIDAAQTQANWRNAESAIMRLQHDITNAWNKRETILGQYAANQAAVDQDAAYRDYLSGTNKQGINYYDLFAKDSNKASGIDFETWMLQNNYSNELTNANRTATNAALNTNWAYQRSTIPWYFRMPKNYPQYNEVALGKKGTKIPKYTQRHTGPKPDEAIWIQHHKDTAKALEKLHEAVVKLFMKSIS